MKRKPTREQKNNWNETTFAWLGKFAKEFFQIYLQKKTTNFLYV